LLLDASVTASELPSSSTTTGHKLRILVADDNEDAAQSLATLLEAVGHEVATAYDGLDAVESAAALRPDVVVLDIGMPTLDGYEAARRIRAGLGGSGMLLIALTGWGQPGDQRQAAAAGFNLHLTKPVDPTKIVAMLAEHRRC
jgi:CheY-like chemotaxis protein